MSTPGHPLPGFNSPAAGFEQPYEMLAACHERVQRTLDLLDRLIAHVAQTGHDAQSRSAAADVLRYFDRAAPLHHQDEELHVFPTLLAGGDAALQAMVHRLQAEHREMETLWAALRPTLLRWCEADGSDAPDATLRAHAARFAQLYAGHIPVEETLVFPGAQAGMAAAQQTAMGEEMQARRRG
ncbi:MAG: hemerythrin domain-containing protein [Hylemonella sp.]|uniref:hemerythrin domain-containing protein n=1 Tax=Hylemonella sp. TaxID=2066020 RepID=UPI0022C2C8A0|nr:hemerythrin domain-containing protein [Hylemonella sp.]MCZ8253173.1 hemerythrin domain-containing protein [Hylemonella sp.]